MRSKLVALAVVSTLSLVACEQILGLDHFAKCDGSACDSALDGSLESGPVDSGSDVFSLPDGISEASSWARWRMPNTLSEVKLGAPDANLRAFDAGTAGVLFDEVTGLYWSMSVGPATTSFEEANAYCAQLPGGWRLPTRIELVSLLDSTRAGTSALVFPPEFDPALADGGSPPLIWTSSDYRPILNNALQYWYVSSTFGEVIAAPNNSAAGVLCVR